MTGFATSAFLLGLLASLGALAALMALTYALNRRAGRHSGVDVTWGLAFVTVALTCWALALGEGGDGRRTLILTLVALWGLRLAVHIFVRNGKHDGEDPRYTDLLDRAEAKGQNREVAALLRIYLQQAVAAWLISMPIQVAMFQRGEIGVLGWVGVAVFAVGLFFEAVGDYQLTVFKRDPNSKGKVLDTGLWSYTRHPNYFGDACVWWGFGLIAFQMWPGILTLPAPLIMTWLLSKGTGAATLEKDIGERRPGYRDYVLRTSGFVPLPPKKHVPETAPS